MSGERVVAMGMLVRSDKIGRFISALLSCNIPS
jgi:hypothetical protein